MGANYVDIYAENSYQNEVVDEQKELEKHGTSFIAVATKASLAYLGTKKFLSSNLMKNTAIGKNASMITALSLGASFLINAVNEDSSTTKTVAAVAGISLGSMYKQNFISMSDEFYEAMEGFNKAFSMLNKINHSFQEWGMESRQLYRERGKDVSRFEVISKNFENLLNAFDGSGLERSKAYHVMKNDMDGLFNSEYLTARDYEKLKNISPHLQDYVSDYTRINMKIDKTTLRSTDLNGGIGYFVNRENNAFKPTDNVDSSKVFTENLNEDFSVLKSEADLYKRSLGIVGDTTDSLTHYKRYLTSKFRSVEGSIKESNPSLDENEIFELTKKHFIENDDDPIMKALIKKQASGNELKVNEYVDMYNREIINQAVDLRTSEPQLDLDEIQLSDGFNAFVEKLASFRKGDNNTFFNAAYGKLDDSDLAKTIFRNVDNSDFNLFKTFDDDKYDFIGNMRVHKSLVKRDDGKLIDRTFTDGEVIFKSLATTVENHFTPFFKSFPLLPDSFRRFNVLSPFKMKERLVNSLSDTSINTFKEANYNVDDSLIAIKDFMKSIRFLKDDLDNTEDGKYSFVDSVDKLNKNIKSSQEVNEMYGINSFVKYDRRSFTLPSDKLNMYNKENTKEVLNNIEQRAFQEYEGLLNKRRDGYKGFHVYSDFENATSSSHSYHLSIENEDYAFTKTLNNKNNVIVVDNTSYVRTAEFHGTKEVGSYSYKFEKGDEGVVYSKNAYLKKLQAERFGKSVTADASKSGVYIREDEYTSVFDKTEFMQSDSKLKYWTESDININPFSSRINVNDEANIFAHYVKRYEELRDVIQFAKSSEDKNDIDDIMLFALGKNSRLRLSHELEMHELKDVSEKIITKANSIKDNSSKQKEFIDFIQNDFTGDDVLNIFGKETSDFLNTFDSRKLDNLSNSFEVLEHFKNISRKIDDVRDDSLVPIAEKFSSLGLKEDTNLRIALRKYETDLALLKSKPSFENTTPELSDFASEEVERVARKTLVSDYFKLSGNVDEFEKTVGSVSDNTFVNLDKLRHMDRENYIADSEATLVKQSFKDLDIASDGILKTGYKIFKEFQDNSYMSNEASVFATEMFESIENVYNVFGIKKLNVENKVTAANYMEQFLKKRILNIAGTVFAAMTVNAVSDVLIPDDVPVVGEGIFSAGGEVVAAARYSLQVAINSVGLGYIFRKLEEQFPGMFTASGLISALDLSDTNEELYGKIYLGDDVAVKKNRFWYTSGRQSFEGGETETYRKHLLYSMRHRDSGVYENKLERFVRKDFLPTSVLWYLADPYKEERELTEQGKVFPKSEQLFSDVFLLGGLLSATLGEAIKPTLYMHEELWKAKDGYAYNPAYNPNDPSSQPLIKYDEPNFLEKVFVPFYESATTMTGLRGYMFKTVTDFMFGGFNTTSGETVLESLDVRTSTSRKYEDLNLGGMFGLTEGIRRIYDSNRLDVNYINPVLNDNLSWMPKEYYKNFNYGAFGIGIRESSLQGLSENSDFYTKLTALAINAPFSSEFKKLKTDLVKNFLSGKMSDDEIYSSYKALSFANGITGDDVYDRINLKADLTNFSVKVNKVTDFGEFTDSSGTRYKLAGLSPSSENPYGKTEKVEDLKTFMETMSEKPTLQVFKNSDSALSVKTDEKGMYYEVYAPEFDKLKGLRSEHYLRENATGVNPLNSAFETFQNAFKTGYLEKSFNRKDAYTRFYEESIITPQFKNWKAPIETYLNPYFDLASSSPTNFLTSLIISRNVGDGSLVMPALITANAVKGLFFGANTPEHYQEEDEITNTLQAVRRSKGESSFFTMSNKDNLNKLKSYLSPTERKYFKDLINVSDYDSRQNIYEGSSERLRKVLDVAWGQQARFAKTSYSGYDVQQEKDIPIGPANFDTTFSNDSNIAFAQLRQNNYGKNYAYERPTLSRLLNKNEVDENREIINSLLETQQRVKSKKTLSTTFFQSVDYKKNNGRGY